MSMFQRSASPVHSEVGEPSGDGQGSGVNKGVPVGFGPEHKKGALGEGVGSQGLFRAGPKAAVKVGRGPVAYDMRKFKYDVTRGQNRKVAFDVSKEDRMPAEVAGAKLHELHQLYGIENEDEGVLSAFDKALLFCHTLNSGSVVTPGRAGFTVAGMEFVSYDQIRDKLGVDMRRFFRAFADDTAVVNKDVLDAYDPYDVVSVEMHGQLMQVAYDRGMQRYPHLAHDSADACTKISPAERAALAASKASVLGKVVNLPDTLDANSRATTLDQKARLS